VKSGNDFTYVPCKYSSHLFFFVQTFLLRNFCCKFHQASRPGGATDPIFVRERRIVFVSPIRKKNRIPRTPFSSVSIAIQRVVRDADYRKCLFFFGALVFSRRFVRR